MFASLSHTAARTVLGTAGTLLFAGACLFGATAPAAAATPTDDVRVATVTYADLNLSSVSGRAALDRRIRTAARDVCSIDSRDLRALSEQKLCFEVALAKAQVQVNSEVMVASN